MTEKYNNATSMHYSAYRPPLHKMILERAIGEKHNFEVGLDIGCGTGYSSIALLNHCEKVHGIDPSDSMLQEAEPHDSIIYRISSGKDIPLPNSWVDIVTFAGSLFYAKSDLLIEELKRVCKNNTLVIVYDFQVLTDEMLLELKIDLNAAQSNYDFEINFSDCPFFKEISVNKEEIVINATNEQVAHVLLSSSVIYKEFVKKYEVQTPQNKLVLDLNSLKTGKTLKSVIYYSVYKYIGTKNS